MSLFFSARVATAVIAVIAIALFFTSVSFSQANDNNAVRSVQAEVRRRIIDENPGGSSAVTFENDAVVSIHDRNSFRVAGNGRYRSGRSNWRVFSYEGLVNRRGGSVTSAQYLFSNYPVPDLPPGQRDHEMVWSGNVDAVVRIRIRGRSATVRTVSGRIPTGVNYDFFEALPNRPVNVSVRRKEGRGRVEIIEQPDRQNNYTAVIEVRDDRGGTDFYSFELDWNSNEGNPPGGGCQMQWEGNVDGVIQISIRDTTATYRTISGRNPTFVRTNFVGRLPRREVEVTVSPIEGRGNVTVIEQPNRSNGFTAVIQVSDPRGGADRYAFTLDWDTRRGDDNPSEARMSWSGSVDAVVTVSIRGRTATARTVSGQTVSNVRYNFYYALPNRNVTVEVDKREGRGEVRVIQQPNRQNNYTAVIEIRDPRGGRDDYEFELNW